MNTGLEGTSFLPDILQSILEQKAETLLVLGLSPDPYFLTEFIENVRATQITSSVANQIWIT